MYLSIGQAASALGVSVSTMRRWELEGFLVPAFRTFGGHRRYALEALDRLFSDTKHESFPSRVKAVAYARVSSHDQKKDLETQKLKLTAYCQQHFQDFEVIADLGSGLNYKKPGLKKLLRLIFLRKVSHLVLNHKDRLLRFGSEIIFELCKYCGVKVTILEEPQQRCFEQELASDVIELMTVFSSKLYGRRSHKNRQAVAA
jgi:predicted site-specific integrase-resolvase